MLAYICSLHPTSLRPNRSVQEFRQSSDFAVVLARSKNKRKLHPDDEIFTCVTIFAKKGKADELEDKLLQNALLARQEEGCISYDVHRGVENTGVFFLYERWKNKAALDAHFQMSYMQACDAVRDTYVEKREMNVMNRLG